MTARRDSDLDSRPRNGSPPLTAAGVSRRPPSPAAAGRGRSRLEAHLPASILIVAEPGQIDPSILERLRGDGHALHSVPSGEQALAISDLSEFNLVLIDALLPGISGFDTSRDLRARSDIAIIFVTSAASLPERLLGFDVGADDYITTPVEFSELDRRIRAVLSRVRGAASRGGRELYGPSGIHMRPRAHQVFVGDELLQLTPKEYSLFAPAARASRRSVELRRDIERDLGLRDLWLS